MQYKQNWSGNIDYSSSVTLYPENAGEVQQIVKSSKYSNIKVFGTRHCFNRIADSAKTKTAAHLNLAKMKKIQYSKSGNGTTVKFDAGLTYSELISAIAKEGLAIQNLPSLPHINVVGSMITATHGSGPQHQIQASLVTEIDIIFADGTLKTLNRENTQDFDHYLINFGGLGVVTAMAIKVEPKFMVFKSIYQDLDWDTLFANFDEIMNKQDYLSFFMNWKEKKMYQVWLGQKYKVGEEAPAFQSTYYGAKHIVSPTNQIHMISTMDPQACVICGGGEWKDKIYHFLPHMKPSSAGDEIQSEYFVRKEHLIQTLLALYEIREEFNHLVQCTEIRQVKGDNIPMSPAHGEEGSQFIGIHFTWFKKHDEIVAACTKMEKVMAAFNAKPHVGKLFVMSGPAFQKLYGDDLVSLRKLVNKHDPLGKFSNEYIRQYIFNHQAKL